ncbi:unnamed protein product [Cochlearia groenlandica]
MESNSSRLVNGYEYYDVGFGVPSSSDFDLRTDHHNRSIWVQDDQDQDSENTLLKYVNQLLMEETLAENQSLYYDSLALRKTEEMLQQVITDSQNQSYTITSNSSYSSGNTTSSSSSSSGSDYWISNSNINFNETKVLYDPPHMLPRGGGFGQTGKEFLVRSMFSDAESSAMQFKRGLEEASKFLPNTNQWIFDKGVSVFPDKEEKGLSFFSKTKKNRREREEQQQEEDDDDDDVEITRSSKQSAVNVEDGKLTEMFDKVLLLDKESDLQIIEDGGNGSSKAQGKVKREGGRSKKKAQAVDFRTLLTLCAQSVSSGDKITSDDLLKKIRKQCSPLGDASQRVAHFFANALEFRLQGSSGSVTIQSYYDSIASKKRTAAQILKSYSVYLSSSPFLTLIYFYSNKMILDASKDCSVLHIIDFGILYGFQWPMFIQKMANSETGPRKLRITGVEIPQHGLRPTERIDDTGRRLTEYCKRFGVPFEYNAIAAKNWEMIKLDEFKLRPDEVLAVNMVMRFKNLRDVSPKEDHCPRDKFCKLIREMNPSVFLSSTVNGSFNAPFFTTRFKEALFHYSALFDVFGSTLSRDNAERIHFEGEFYGREVMNVIACEGVERVERPETYKQWQVRMVRAGFKQKVVETEVVESFRGKLKKWGYHKDFVLDQDSNWFLQGWKGRILFSTSCWVPY